MRNSISSWLFIRLLFKPAVVFDELSDTRPSPYSVFFRFLLWMAVAPPLFAYIGASKFGWRLGAADPLYLSAGELIPISLTYFAALIFGFMSTALISQWMAATYGARASLGIHLAMVTIVGAPLVAGSAVHLFPHVFINILVLIPALIWSMYLLYRGLPVVLQISPERGMLMSSALIGWLLVAAVCLLGLMVSLWGRGIGPSLGV
jgi:hypothetical protein